MRTNIAIFTDTSAHTIAVREQRVAFPCRARRRTSTLARTTSVLWRKPLPTLKVDTCTARSTASHTATTTVLLPAMA